MLQVAEITINKVSIAIRQDAEAGVYVGFCPRFNVYSQGETTEEAVEAVSGAICMRIKTAFEHGRVDKILRQAGFERFVSANAPDAPSPDDEFVSVTFRSDVEVREIGIRVPLGAILHQRSMECQH